MKRKYTKELLEEAVKGCISYAQLLKKLNLNQNGGNHATIKRYIYVYDIDVSHFTGQAWANGQTAKTNKSIEKQAQSASIPNEEVFVEKSTYSSSTGLRKKMIQVGFEYRCKICGLEKWMGKEITLHIDHINGIHSDNRKENIRFLCPCCHQQTSTWGSKNREKYPKITDEKTLCECGDKKSVSAERCKKCENERREKIFIEKEELQRFISNNLSFSEISRIYGVSVITIRRKVKKYNLL